jgi:hypothetical protein
MALRRWARVLKGAATASRPIVFDFYPSESRQADEAGEPFTQREDSCAFQQPRRVCFHLDPWARRKPRSSLIFA